MSYQTDLRGTPIPENSTALITFTVKDENGSAIAGSGLATLTVTLYNDADKAVINSRSATNILGANGGSVDESGAGQWLMSPADNPIVTDTSDTYDRKENHTAEFAWTYGGGAKTGRHVVRLAVFNLVKVTS